MRYTKNYGWIPDIPDQRDYLYSAIKPVIKLLKKIDLQNDCSEIEQQGKLGSCTAQALAGNLEFLDKKIDGEYVDVSRLFIYYNERALIGTINYDSGASLRDGIKTLKKDGACHEETWPYAILQFDKKPPKKCYDEAKKHLIESYHRLYTIPEMLTCLAEGYPFVFGFSVYESFESMQVKRTGIVNMPKKSEIEIGGHAVMAVGYNQADKRFLVRNSWGRNWGADGYFTMPFEYLETLADDFWTIRRQAKLDKFLGKESMYEYLDKMLYADEAYLVFDKLIYKIEELSRKEKFYPIFIYINGPGNYKDITDNFVCVRVKDAIDKYSIPFIDLRNTLMRSDYFKYDVHWKPSGHYKAAVAIKRFLDKDRPEKNYKNGQSD